MMSKQDILLYEKKGKISLISLNCPEKLNAIDQKLSDRIYDALEQFDNDEDAWVAIITGVGDKAFSAGGDLNDPQEIKGATSGELPNWYLKDIWKPMIAAINGYCMTLGWALAQKCDIRIAAEHAQFSIKATRFNFSGAFASDLVRRVHLAHALEIMLWGDNLISAQRAYEMGWVNKVVPKEKLMEEAMSWAERMLYLAPRSVRNIKQMLYHGYDMSPAAARAFAMALSANLSSMEDTAEAIRSFFEKRKPVFRNR
jgi:enoyl-CoA hydratase/carnithine racemase